MDDPGLVEAAMTRFATFAALQALNFVLITVNYRAVAHQQYAWAIVTDGVICLLGWSLLKRVMDAQGWPARSGYIVGGMVGSAAGMYLTRVWG